MRTGIIIADAAARRQAADILQIVVLILAGIIILSVVWDHFKKGRH
jgi:cytochrome bd-type quinol oxidase subunit 2